MVTHPKGAVEGLLRKRGYKRISIWLTPERAAELEALAAERKQTPTLVATDCLVNYLRWRRKLGAQIANHEKERAKTRQAGKLALTDEMLDFLK